MSQERGDKTNSAFEQLKKVNFDDILNDSEKDSLYTNDGIAYNIAIGLNRTSVSQLRNFLTSMQSARERMKDDRLVHFEATKLIPVLANMTAKKGGPIPKEFYDSFSSQLQKIRTRKGFDALFDFYCAIVEFHAMINEGRR